MQSQLHEDPMTSSSHHTFTVDIVNLQENGENMSIYLILCLLFNNIHCGITHCAVKDFINVKCSILKFCRGMLDTCVNYSMCVSFAMQI